MSLRAALEMHSGTQGEKEKAVVLVNPSILSTARQLISVYEKTWLGAEEDRVMAVEAIAALCELCPAVVDLVIESSEAYSRAQHIDDAYPYSPNGFTALAKLGPLPKVLLYLCSVAARDYGVAQAEAIAARREMSSALAKHCAATACET